MRLCPSFPYLVVPMVGVYVFGARQLGEAAGDEAAGVLLPTDVAKDCRLSLHCPAPVDGKQDSARVGRRNSAQRS